MSLLKKRKSRLFYSIFLGLLIVVILDRIIWMPHRITNNLWEFKKGKYYIGESISNDNYTLNNNRLVFKNGEKSEIIGCYFSRLIISDSKWTKIGIYKPFSGSDQWRK
jgi:hypothetical protein